LLTANTADGLSIDPKFACDPSSGPTLGRLNCKWLFAGSLLDSSEKIVEELCAPKIGCTKFVVIWKLFGARSFPVAPVALQMTVPNWQIPSDR
jgi:hypothetical protein